MHAIHFSPHTIQTSRRFGELVGLVVFELVSMVTLAALVFAGIGWYLWNFS
jgi:hypothetical protein